MTRVLYTANPRSAYRAGYLSGAFSVRSILDHGDFGLGALADNDGELVILDGEAFTTSFDGTTTPVSPDTLSPYASVLPFEPDHTRSLCSLDRCATEAMIGRVLPLQNRIWALKMHGEFRRVVAGASPHQQKPYRPMAQVMDDYNWLDNRDTVGTLVGFVCPPLLEGINFVGFHWHWLSADRQRGGHVTDFDVRAVELTATRADSFLVDVAKDDDLHRLNLVCSPE